MSGSKVKKRAGSINSLACFNEWDTAGAKRLKYPAREARQTSSGRLRACPGVVYYYAAFAGCSAETEASFETITFLAGKVDELSLPAVMTIEGTDHRIAETIVQNTQSKNQQILTLDSMQSTTAGDVQNGTTYLSTMDNNLSVLKEALK